MPQALNYLVQAAVAARDLIAQGLESDEACEHAAQRFDVPAASVVALLHAWRELPVEFDPPPLRVTTW